MRVLFVSLAVPFPPTRGHRIRNWMLLRALAEEGHDVSLLAFAEPHEIGVRQAPLEAVCREVEFVPIPRGTTTQVRATLARLRTLASRLPYGTSVHPAVLGQIDRAERSIRALGFRELRVRHLGTIGLVELGADDLARARRTARSVAAIEGAVRAAGYAEGKLSESPLRSGSFSALRRPLPITVSP